MKNPVFTEILQLYDASQHEAVVEAYTQNRSLFDDLNEVIVFRTLDAVVHSLIETKQWEQAKQIASRKINFIQRNPEIPVEDYRHNLLALQTIHVLQHNTFSYTRFLHTYGKDLQDADSELHRMGMEWKKKYLRPFYNWVVPACTIILVIISRVFGLNLLGVVLLALLVLINLLSLFWKDQVIDATLKSWYWVLSR